MHVGQLQAGNTFVDHLGHCDQHVVIDEEGWGVFPVAAGSVSVWRRQAADTNQH